MFRRICVWWCNGYICKYKPTLFLRPELYILECFSCAAKGKRNNEMTHMKANITILSYFNNFVLKVRNVLYKVPLVLLTFPWLKGVLHILLQYCLGCCSFTCLPLCCWGWCTLLKRVFSFPLALPSGFYNRSLGLCIHQLAQEQVPYNVR